MRSELNYGTNCRAVAVRIGRIRVGHGPGPLTGWAGVEPDYVKIHARPLFFDSN